MKDDILESVSQRGDGAYDEENRRIQEVSDELQRLCRLHEAEPRDGKSNGGRFEIEQRGPPGPSGNENDTYVSNDIIYKVNMKDKDGDMYVIDAEIAIMK